MAKNVSSLYRLESYNADSYPNHINTVRSRETEKLSFADEVATKPLVAQSAKPTTQPINVLLKELKRMD